MKDYTYRRHEAVNSLILCIVCAVLSVGIILVDRFVLLPAQPADNLDAIIFAYGLPALFFAWLDIKCVRQYFSDVKGEILCAEITHILLILITVSCAYAYVLSGRSVIMIAVLTFDVAWFTFMLIRKIKLINKFERV